MYDQIDKNFFQISQRTNNHFNSKTYISLIQYKI